MAEASTSSGGEGSPIGRRFGVGLAIIAAVAIVVLAAKILLVLFAGVLLAIALSAGSRFVAKHTHLPYLAALALIVIAWLGATIAAIVLLAPSVAQQVSALLDALPKALSDVRHHLHRIPVLATHGADKELGADPKTVALSAVSAAGTSVEVLGGFAVVFFVGLYGAAQPRAYLDAALSIAPASSRRRLEVAFEDAGQNLSRWLAGRALAMLFVGVTATIAFWALGVPLAGTLGALSGILTFVEYIGAVASGIPPTLLAFTKSPALALGVLGIFTVLHVIEGYVLTPLLARLSVRIPPAFALGAQVLLGALLGPLGLTFATPLLVVIASFVRAWRETDATTTPT
jgi:predicted PurR-regulated permease PerM